MRFVTGVLGDFTGASEQPAQLKIANSSK